jgi:uncharacterized damage-inducible protein DinB
MSQLKEILLAHTGYSAWAMRQVLEACSDLTLEQLERGFGASHSSLLGTFRHIHDGERVWLIRLGQGDSERLPVNRLRRVRLSFWFNRGLSYGMDIGDGSKRPRRRI